MRQLAIIACIGLLLPACTTLRNATAANDDVYDLPDREAMAAARAVDQQSSAAQQDNNDYYDAAQAKQAGSAYRDYYSMTYNDPYYYNYGRFGFGSGIGGYGPGMGMGISYGWPTSFGSMGISYGTGFGYGYNPYWSNSWMSGYGYSPYSGYNPYGYYGYGNYGYGYGGYGMGYGPYQGPFGGCYGCYEPVGYGNTVYSHRPAMASGSTGTTVAPAPRMMMRNPAGLIPDAPPARSTGFDGGRTPAARSAQPDNMQRMPDRSMNRQTESRPMRSFENSSPAPTRSFGGSFGGGGGGGRSISSPRPR